MEYVEGDLLEGVIVKLDGLFPRLSHENKVRHMFDISRTIPQVILMVASDQISASDVVLKTPIPDKGKVLNQISAYWFKKTEHICPNHFISDNLDGYPLGLDQEDIEILQGRSMLVQLGKVVPFECIVRGDILGSGYDSYKKTGKVHGIPLPKGLNEGDKLPAPIFTPSTKAEHGEHDRNVTFEEMAKSVGPSTTGLLQAYSLSLFSYLANSVILNGIRIRDTKLEFSFLRNHVMVIDEIGTPDSSRFYPDLSKQVLRDYLKSIGWDETSIELPSEIVKKIRQNYLQVCKLITGKSLA